MTAQIELTEDDLRKLVLADIRSKLNYDIAETDIKIQVKTKTNYRTAEWEPGAFRATVTVTK